MNAACMSARIDVQREGRLPAERQPNFRLLFDVTQRFARPQEIRDQFAAARDRRVAIAAPVGEFEGRLDELTAIRDVCGPRHDGGGKESADEALKPPQAFARDQFKPQPAEANTGFEVAKVPAGYEPQVCVGEAGAVAMATLETEFNGCAGQQGPEIHARDRRRRHDPGHDIEDCA